VYRVARAIHQALAGQVLTRTDFRVPEIATADLSGQTVLEVVSRGKHMLTRTDKGLTLHTHLKMEGAWHIYGTGRRWGGGPWHEIRAILQNRTWTAVGYRLGIVELVPTAQEDRIVGHLGPDLLGPDWELEEAVSRIRRNPQISIGEALIDQRHLAGIGNLYKNEVLFVSGINPWTEVANLRDLTGLITRARRMLTLNTAHWVQATTGNTSRGQQHWVFERAGRPCRRCGTPIRVGEQGLPGVARLTYWCPTCQPSSPARRPKTRKDTPAST
jgi:endonuclease-8